MIINPYDNLASDYEQTSEKPDKKYSTLPTVLQLAGDMDGKTVVDLGCGSGFFARHCADAGAAHAIGVDNSEGELAIARAHPHSRVEFMNRNIFSDALPTGDVVLAAYVINYASSSQELKKLFDSVHTSIAPGGKFIGVIDEPAGHDTRRFGALKFLEDDRIRIELFNDEKFVCELFAHYFSRDQIETALREVGFKNITWHVPIISGEGLAKFGEDFWKNYAEQCELGYFVAITT